MPADKAPGEACPQCGSGVVEYQHMDERFARWACHQCRASGQMPAFDLIERDDRGGCVMRPLGNNEQEADRAAWWCPLAVLEGARVQR